MRHRALSSNGRLSKPGTHLKARRRSCHTLEPPHDGSMIHKGCSMCGHSFSRMLAPGALAAAFKFCDACRVRAGSTIEGGTEAKSSELEYMTG